MFNVLSLDNIKIFRKEYNDKMKIVFGVDNWIECFEKQHQCKLEDFIGKTFEEIKDIISYIDRDFED